MTVRNDLERSIAMAEAAKGNYLLFATESEDQKARSVFEDMAEDMERHVKILESRRDYLDEHNQLNARSGGEDEDQDQGQKKHQNKEKK